MDETAREAAGGAGWDFLVSYAPNAADGAWAEWICRALKDAGYTVHVQAWGG